SSRFDPPALFLFPHLVSCHAAFIIFCVFCCCILLKIFFFLISVFCCNNKQGAGGVFMLIEGGRYTFNATAAAAACRSLNVTMATRAQMERALQRGLETCKFGWIAETIAVVPRRTADDKCGKGKTGVVTWFARADQKFGVFCFNASDLEGTPNGSTSGPHGSTQPSTPTAPTQTSRPATTPLRPASGSPPSMKPVTTRAPEETSFTSALLIQTSHSTSVSSSSSSPTLKPFSTHILTSLSPLITSKPTVVSLVFSTSASTFSLSSESGTTGATKPPLGSTSSALRFSCLCSKKRQNYLILISYFNAFMLLKKI
uniref:Link domain-containing protein n=1 Tax=Cyclopterus lumpus TaxID=8103 RepID=A0A8C2Z669_CYCLU